MPIDKGRLTSKPVTLEVEWDGDVCRIVYNRLAISYGALKEMAAYDRDAPEEGTVESTLHGIRASILQLKRFLIEWDLTDGGKPLPITEEILGELDPDFVGKLLGAIWEDYRDDPNPTRPAGSGGSASSLTEPAGSSTNGISSAGSPGSGASTRKRSKTSV